MEISFHNHSFVLDGRRALFWREKKWLLFADAHWGKTHFFQKHGLSVGHAVFHSDLKRLESLIRDYQPDMLICLGDLIHHEDSLGRSLKESISEFRDKNPIPLTLIRGNHERYIKDLPLSWGIDIIEDCLEVAGLNLCHENENKLGPQLYGHLHPKLTMSGDGDRVTLPCFYLKGRDLILPAFSDFCGGVNIELKKNEKAYLCLDEQRDYGTQKSSGNTAEVICIP